MTCRNITTIKTILIMVCIAFSALAGSNSSAFIKKSWKDRDFLHSDIIKTEFTDLDTLVSEGFIALARPKVIFKTDREFILFKAGTLYTYTEGSDVGLKIPLESYMYSNIQSLIEQLEKDFEVAFSKDKSISMKGTGGKGEIISFEIEFDKDAFPIKASWTDIFCYRTRIDFLDSKCENPGEVFTLPQKIEFILQQ